jgi:tryptophan-rich sensory protein
MAHASWPGWRPGWLVGFLAASFGAAALGGLCTARSVGTWYRALRKPRLTPPDRVFGPVWTALYALMALAAWLVQRDSGAGQAPRRAARLALGVWGLQLGLNVLWSAVFFGARRIGAGLAVCAALWVAVAACACLAARVAPAAGALLVPYLAWTTFAAFLNFRIWQLNRGRRG